MHIMIDTETFGTDDNAPIIQLGAVAFIGSTPIPNPGAPSSVYCEHGSFLVNINLTELLLIGYETSKDTIGWWRKQDNAAKAGLLNPPFGVKEAATKFYEWLMEMQHGGLESRLEGVWSHGAAFDLPKVRELFRRVDAAEPWPFRLDRDTRTLYQLAETKGWQRGDKPVIAHNALHDARAQAKDVVSAMAWLMGGGK